MVTPAGSVDECPDCRQPATDSRAFTEELTSGAIVHWCAFVCAQGHWWARLASQVPA